MGCTRPLKAYWRSVARDGITFDVNKSCTKISFALPCGRCIGCRLEKARQWGLRCLHEAKMWEKNVYVTLTYSDEYLPEGGTLCLRDVQLFMKRLRKARAPSRIRFFAGGEYGETNGRPHYHLLIFNCEFVDAVPFTEYKGNVLYTSKELSELWFQGHCTIGAVTFDSAVYCAKYALKKVNGEMAGRHYEFIDEDGIVYKREPEFAVMSRRPGIGRLYFDKYGKEVLAHDSVVVNGKEVRPPRYYDVLNADEPKMERNKARRKRMSVLNRFDNTAERLRVKERLMELAAKHKERKL